MLKWRIPDLSQRFLCGPLLALALAVPLVAQAPVVKDVAQPAAIAEELWLVPAGWASRIPPQGSVNAPGRLEALSPGQRVAVAVLATGDSRDRLLSGRLLSLRITTGTGVVVQKDLKPVALRHIKATGTDMVMLALDAAEIKGPDRAAIAQLTTMVSLAVFESNWEVPASAKAETIRLEATLTGGTAPIPKLKPATLRVLPWPDWRKEPETDPDAWQREMNAFHHSPQPGRLVPLLEAAARAGALEQPPVSAFFVAAFRAHPAAKEEAVRALPSMDPASRAALLAVLRMSGDDISNKMGDLSENAKSSLSAIPVLDDPRTFPSFVDPVDPSAVRAIGVTMDRCWGSWMATGDPSYLRALVGLLNGAPDFDAFQKWVQEKGGAAGLSARVARGLAYQIAGWSLASFQRTDPQVSDWLLYWQDDPELPSALREQIRSIPQNPAFKR